MTKANRAAKEPVDRAKAEDVVVAFPLSLLTVTGLSLTQLFGSNPANSEVKEQADL